MEDADRVTGLRILVHDREAEAACTRRECTAALAIMADENDALRAELARREKQVHDLRRLRESDRRHLDALREKLGQQSDAIIELSSKLAGVDPTTPVSEFVRQVAVHNPTFNRAKAQGR